MREPNFLNLLKNAGFLLTLLVVLSFIPKFKHSGPEVRFEYSRETVDMRLFDIKENSNGHGEKDVHETSGGHVPLNVDSHEETFEDTINFEDQHGFPDVFEQNAASTTSLIETGTKPIEPEKRVIDASIVASFNALDQNTTLTDSQYLREFNKLYYETKVRGVKPASRTDVVIRYYKKPLDGDNVYALQQSGFYIHERTSKEEVQQYATNAIFYGADVSLEDVKMVAFMLLRKGIKIQEIAPYTLSNDWKARSIELATDITKLDAPEYGLAEIRNLRF